MNLHPLKLYHGLFGPTVGPTMLGVVASVLAVVGNGYNNSQQCWPITRVGLSRNFIALLSPRRPCVMSVPSPNNVGKAVQKLCASAITERKKCWELLA